MMQCEDCGRTIQPIVALDIDGVLADYRGHFAAFAELWLGREQGPTRRPPWVGQYRDWFCEAFDVDVTTFRKIKLAYRQGGQKRFMPATDGAAELYRLVRSLNVDVWFTTTRPHDRYDAVDPDTREWLRRNGFDFDGLLFNDDKYRELVERVSAGRVAAVIDDEVENLQMALDAGIELDRLIHKTEEFLTEDSYTDRLFHAPTLRDAGKRIKHQVAEWRMENE